MKRLCFIVYGNVAAGKTTFAEMMKKNLPGFEYAGMDEIRLKWADKYPKMNTKEREKKCETDFLLKVIHSKNLILEHTAINAFFKVVEKRVKEFFNVYYVHIKCSPEVCEQRYFMRKAAGHRGIPLPGNNKMSFLESRISMAEKQKKIHADIVLNAEKLTPAQMWQQFLKVFRNRINNHLNEKL